MRVDQRTDRDNKNWFTRHQEIFSCLLGVCVQLKLILVGVRCFREEYLAKIQRRVKEYKIQELNAPRPGKKLLVLDIDYTLFGELDSLPLCPSALWAKKRCPFSGRAAES